MSINRQRPSLLNFIAQQGNPTRERKSAYACVQTVPNLELKTADGREIFGERPDRPP
jgi:hypothetical protein